MLSFKDDAGLRIFIEAIFNSSSENTNVMKQKRDHQSGKAPEVRVNNIANNKKEQVTDAIKKSTDIRFFEQPVRRRYSFDDNGGGYTGL